MKRLLSILLVLSSATVLTAQPDPLTVPIEFEYHHKLAATDSGVGVAGSFDGWQNVFPASQAGHPNIWLRTIPIREGGIAYKIVTYNKLQGLSGVTNWITDPLNPKFGGPFNDSQLRVSNPIVYYLLPKDGNTVTENPPAITAKISWRNDDNLDPASIQLVINGVPVVNSPSYFDLSTRRFSYTPPGKLALGETTLELSAKTVSGAATKTASTFTMFDPKAILSAPFTFVFDSRSPNFQYLGAIQTVSVTGEFNLQGADALSDPDKDGLWTATVNMRPEKPSQYEFVVNGGYYIADPDNPRLSGSYKTVTAKQVRTAPSWDKFSHRDGQIFNFPTGSVSLNAVLIPSDSGIAINRNSIKAWFDGKPVASPIFVPNSGGWMTVVNQSNIPAGRHVLTFAGADVAAHPSETASLSFGVYPPNSGFHYIDSFGDDRGNGSYIYRADIPPGSADLLEMHVAPNAAADSLLFTIVLDTLSSFSKMELFLLKDLLQTRTRLADLDLDIPEWRGNGVRLPLANPAGTAYLSGYDNLIYSDDGKVHDGVLLDPLALRANTFRFGISLAKLKSALGNYAKPWYFAAFTYLGEAGRPLEVDASMGGSDERTDPNVWDVAFTPDRQTQYRLLGNFIPPNQTGGERYAALATDTRGWQSIPASRIGSNLGGTVIVELLTKGGPIDAAQVTLRGKVTPAAAGTAVTLHLKDNQTLNLLTDAAGGFAATLNLGIGDNEFFAAARDGQAVASSPKVNFSRRAFEKLSRFTVAYGTGGNSVALAMVHEISSAEPKRFVWSQDPGNPQRLKIPDSTSQSIGFPLPDSLGHYFLTAKTYTAKDSHTVRVWLVRDKLFMPPPPLNAHAPWIDNAVVYEIFPRTFSPEGKLNKVTARLDELKALGINCIWFMPIHPSPTTHGYAITDYFDINPEYGTLADFRALVQEAHKRGIRVIIDVVIQHSSFLHPFMQDAYTYGPASPFYDFYIWNAPQNYHYEFTWVDLPSINYDSAATRDYLLRMIRYWFEEYDIDGVRCDVAHVIESLRPPGPAFWQEMRRMIRDLKADALLLAEADALSLQSIFDLKFDAAYDWNIFTKIKNFIGGQLTIANFNAELNNYTPQRGFPSHALPFRFLENHDEERFIKSHNVAETKQAGALLMTLPGLPMLYAGQEVGELEFRSIINWSDPNQLRPYYQKLVQLRRQHPALQQGQLTLLNATPSEQIYAYLRASGKDVMLAAHNLSTGNVKAKIALKGLNLPFKAYWFDELTRQGYVHGDTLVVNLASRASAILVPSHSITAVEGPAMALPRTFALQQNFPNPFNPETRLRYSVPENGRRFSLRIFNVLGQQVKTLFDGTQAAGEHEVIWDGRNSKGELAGTGLYFVVMQAENFRAVRKMMVVR